MTEKNTPAGLPDSDLIFSGEDVAVALKKMADEIQPIIDEGNCVLVGVMLGAMFPLVHLAEFLSGDFLIDSCHATRYQSGLEGKELSWLKQPSADLAGRIVIVVDDIFDQGITIEGVVAACEANGAAKVYSAVLCSKAHDRQVSDFRPDFSALTVPDRYVFGCGMDYMERWRQLPGIYALRDA